MSEEGDARPEPQSSPTRAAARGRYRSYAALSFAAFVLWHLAWQAFRARTDGAPPGDGWEVQPVLVGALLLLVWLPFAGFAWQELSAGRARRMSPAPTERERALTLLEAPALIAVLLFTALHLTQLAGPLLLGTFSPDDIRPEVYALLSSTTYGAPWLAFVHLCGVGAAAFYAARQALKLAPESKALRRGLVALFVIAYLLGSYAVIRCASGSILA